MVHPFSSNYPEWQLEPTDPTMDTIAGPDIHYLDTSGSLPSVVDAPISEERGVGMAYDPSLYLSPHDPYEHPNFAQNASFTFPASLVNSSNGSYESFPPSSQFTAPFEPPPAQPYYVGWGQRAFADSQTFLAEQGQENQPQSNVFHNAHSTLMIPSHHQPSQQPNQADDNYDAGPSATAAPESRPPTPDGQYRCECGAFLSKANRSKNQATHEKSNGHRDFMGQAHHQADNLRCRFCGKGFARSDACRRHEKHCPERPGFVGKVRKSYIRRAKSEVASLSTATVAGRAASGSGTSSSGLHTPSTSTSPTFPGEAVWRFDNLSSPATAPTPGSVPSQPFAVLHSPACDTQLLPLHQHHQHQMHRRSSSNPQASVSGGSYPPHHHRNEGFVYHHPAGNINTTGMPGTYSFTAPSSAPLQTSYSLLSPLPGDSYAMHMDQPMIAGGYQHTQPSSPNAGIAVDFTRRVSEPSLIPTGGYEPPYDHTLSLPSDPMGIPTAAHQWAQPDGVEGPSSESLLFLPDELNHQTEEQQGDELANSFDFSTVLHGLQGGMDEGDVGLPPVNELELNSQFP